MRPLDRLPSLKLKLGTVIFAAVVVVLATLWVGIETGLTRPQRYVLSLALAMVMVQVLARGMTSPLREMAQAAKEMARGDYSRRVRATSNDEVGELARAFNTMAADLAAVDTLRRDLVANVSHELRTPISALQAVLENLVDGVSQPDPETLASMLRQTERLGRLVSQLLDLSRLESGAVPLDVTTFPARPFLEGVCAETAEARRRVSGAAVPVVVEAPDGLALTGDPERVHQVVVNLVDNALRHSPPSGRVVVRASSAASLPAVRLEVCDDGPGIPPEEAGRVFERFSRLDGSRSASGGGSGLGLAIARWIVDLHGGAIRAEPNVPTGCRMVVELPKVAP
ncbi:MAG TPA: ATP-binding protein [Mycobacteriales bacterium]|jgi:signal transduction histidine kinase|nr:ATP-binding protein [Mycobacteriales bacterium]